MGDLNAHGTLMDAQSDGERANRDRLVHGGEVFTVVAKAGQQLPTATENAPIENRLVHGGEVFTMAAEVAQQLADASLVACRCLVLQSFLPGRRRRRDGVLW